MSINVDEIKKVLEKVRPYLQRDGGDLEFVSLEDTIVSIKMLGACKDCIAADNTIKEGIEAILQEEVNEAIQVVQIDN
ncbi:MAG: NifU family protein [Erysipelotrichaceae bacterium]|nr:NifU family protein [Erysipelotrichaceae bacterium]